MAAAAPFAGGAAEDEAIFKLRLLTRTSSHAVVAANRREQDSFRHLQAALARDSAQYSRCSERARAQAEVDIEQLQKDLEVAKVERQHEEECEVVRKLIAAQPSRRATQKATEELEREIAGLERENTALQLTLDQRKKHFAVLFGVVSRLRTILLSPDVPPAPLSLRGQAVADGVLLTSVDDLQAVLEDETGSSFGLDASLPSLGTGSLVLSDLQPPAFLGGATGGATAAAGRTANELRVLESDHSFHFGTASAGVPASVRDCVAASNR
eukprot:SM000055S18214  [mRNA]  locus=s55:31723:34043:+ [translate_table: standard]